MISNVRWPLIVGTRKMTTCLNSADIVFCSVGIGLSRWMFHIHSALSSFVTYYLPYPLSALEHRLFECGEKGRCTRHFLYAPRRNKVRMNGQNRMRPSKSFGEPDTLAQLNQWVGSIRDIICSIFRLPY